MVEERRVKEPIDVVGIGADGWEGLAPQSRAIVESAEVIIGGARHLAMLPASVAARQVSWPSPLKPALLGLLAEFGQQRLVVLASGDPLLSGIGTTLIDLGAEVRIHPAVSSVALACARMGWSFESVDVVTVVGRDIDAVRRLLQTARRLVVLGATPADLQPVLAEVTATAYALTDLGGSSEHLDKWAIKSAQDTSKRADSARIDRPSALTLTCIEVTGGGLPITPGLPDEAFEHDGQITKRDLRASALARLEPGPCQLLWDIGAGAGSVSIEWLRADARARAIAVESNPERGQRIRRNASALGVPSLEIVEARAPEGLDALPTPNAIFVGGGASRDGVLETCWDALPTGGRLVVHAVTVETEQVVFAAFKKHGGELTRISVEHADAIGSFTGWAPARPVTQWAVTK